MLSISSMHFSNLDFNISPISSISGDIIYIFIYLY